MLYTTVDTSASTGETSYGKKRYTKMFINVISTLYRVSTLARPV